ncbi:MAG: PqqD family protein [Actinomycetota bacterium]
MNGLARYRRSTRALTRTVGDVVLIAIPEREGFEKLDGTSSVAWHLLEEPQTAPELIDELARIYGVAATEVAGPVSNMLEVFAARGLVEVAQGAEVGNDG